MAPTRAFRHLAADEKRNTRVQTPGIRGNPNKTVISESGLYKLVMRSDKPDACAFQDWLAREVLPAIRKDGAYLLGEEKVRTGEMSEAELAMQAVAALNAKLARLTAERDQLAAEKAAAEARAVATETKAAALDHLASAEGLLTATEAANLLGMRSAIALNRTLENAKVLRRVRGSWCLRPPMPTKATSGWSPGRSTATSVSRPCGPHKGSHGQHRGWPRRGPPPASRGPAQMGESGKSTFQ